VELSKKMSLLKLDYRKKECIRSASIPEEMTSGIFMSSSYVKLMAFASVSGIVYSILQSPFCATKIQSFLLVNLSFCLKEDDNNNIRANIARYVIMMRSGIKQENVSFEVRLPKEGMYKISIYSGRDDEWGDDPPLTSSFRIVCDFNSSFVFVL
jgi:hypothetical protein